MPIVDIRELAQSAMTARHGLGAFNIIHLEHAEMFTEAAVLAETPVVLQISENAIKFHGGRVEPIVAGTLRVAEAAAVDCVVHLDHAESPDVLKRAVLAGVGSVMYDGSSLPYRVNVETTAALTQWCHSRGVSMEAELGAVGGKGRPHDPGVTTDPAEALEFVSETGVDLLAVAVGSSHAMLTRDATLDFSLISALKAAVPVPLVLHGSSGVSDSDMSKAIQHGMTKINVSTHLNRIYTEAIRLFLDRNPTVVDPRKYVTPAWHAVVQEAARLLRLYAG